MHAFVYEDPEHVAVMRVRCRWFERLDLWGGVPAGHRPSVPEAEERLEHLGMHGSTPAALTFRRHFDSCRLSPAAGVEHVAVGWFCSA